MLAFSYSFESERPSRQIFYKTSNSSSAISRSASFTSAESTAKYTAPNLGIYQGSSYLAYRLYYLVLIRLHVRRRPSSYILPIRVILIGIYN